MTITGLVLAAAACAVAAFWPAREQQAAPVEQAHAHDHEHGPAGEAPVVAVDGAPTRASDQSVGANTRFHYIAVFPKETSSVELEQWRQRVLGRAHETPCVRGSSCLARILRLSGLGAAQIHAVAFDLQAETTQGERNAILSEAVRGQTPPPVLFVGMSAQAAASRYAGLAISLMTDQPPNAGSPNAESSFPATPHPAPFSNLK